MPDLCYLFDRLSPEEAMALLAETAERRQGRGLAGIRIHTIKRGDGKSEVTVSWPDPNALRPRPSDKVEREQALQVAVEVYSRVMRRQPHLPTAPPEPGMELGAGAAWLLTHSVSANPAQRNEDEYLLLARAKMGEEAAKVLNMLRGIATSVRVADSEAGRNTSHYFVHVLDDPNRRGLFRGTVAGQAYGGWSVLVCYTHAGQKVFLPAEFSPGVSTLEHFCRLATAVPELFGSDSKAPSLHELLIAIDRVASEEGSTSLGHGVWYLGHLSFVSWVTLTPTIADQTEFEICHLKGSPTALSELRARIEAVRPYWGYRLDLRRTDSAPVIQDEQRQITEQIVRLEYRLAYLKSLEAPRPRLLRFTQRQLPALADIIRCYPQRTLNDGLIKYGYQATDLDPQGLHFLYIPPESKGMVELDPVGLWEHLDTQPMSFWLDPFWARDYYRPANQSLIFVPEGMALFPPMHDWDVESMDAYIRECMGRWFHGQINVADLPARPIYIFDSAGKSDDSIRISVLDQDALQPLRTRLGWLNDNLVPIHALEMEPFIAKMADGLTRQELADAVAAKAVEAEDSFKGVAHTTNKTIAEVTETLTQTVTAEIESVIQETKRTAGKVADLNKKLRSLQGDLHDMERQEQHIEHLIAQADGRAKGLHTFNLRILKEVEAALLDAAATRQRVVAAVTQEIAALQQVSDDLDRRLDHAFNR